MQKTAAEWKYQCTCKVKDEIKTYAINSYVKSLKHFNDSVEVKCNPMYDDDSVKETQYGVNNFILELWRYGRVDVNSFNYRIKFRCSTTGNATIPLKWNVYIDNGTAISTTCSDCQPVQNETRYELAPNLSINSDKKGIYLKINIEFEVANNFEFHSLNILADYGNLLNSGLHSDVVMRSIDGVEYRAHKAVLACRSPVLKAHFDHNTTESGTNPVESPFESIVLKELLTYIYTNKAPRAVEFPEKLIKAADFYQLDGFKTMCEEMLYQELSVENVVQIFQLADLYQADWLKRKTLEFILHGPGSSIVKTKGWEKLKIEYVKYICDFLMLNKQHYFLEYPVL